MSERESHRPLVIKDRRTTEPLLQLCGRSRSTFAGVERIQAPQPEEQLFEGSILEFRKIRGTDLGSGVLRQVQKTLFQEFEIGQGPLQFAPLEEMVDRFQDGGVPRYRVKGQQIEQIDPLTQALPMIFGQQSAQAQTQRISVVGHQR